jgi:hypothetical protein
MLEILYSCRRPKKNNINSLKSVVILFWILQVYVFQGPFFGGLVSEKDTVDVLHLFGHQTWTACRSPFRKFDPSALRVELDIPLQLNGKISDMYSKGSNSTNALAGMVITITHYSGLDPDAIASSEKGRRTWAHWIVVEEPIVTGFRIL